ncbi:MAG: GDYXXLXY domain-containing protein, partial [Waterburya sp.]
MTSSQTFNSSWWRFLVPLGLQLGIILIVPAQSAYTYNFGQSAVLQTLPVDPYDLLRGYSQTLSYDISQIDSLKQFPGGKDLVEGQKFYVVLELNSTQDKLPPSPSKVIKVTQELPKDLGSNQVALKGKIEQYGQVNYGLETYYLPESQRDKINQEISALQSNSEGKR